MFSSIFGQDRVLQSLDRSIAEGRVANTYLFAGPAGVGKRTTAFDMARVLLCESPGNGIACGSCPSCKRTAHFPEIHPSLLVFRDVLVPSAVVRGEIMHVAGYEEGQQAQYLDAMAALSELGLIQFSPSAGQGLGQVDCYERTQAAVFERADSKVVSIAAIDRTIDLIQKETRRGVDPHVIRLAEHIFRNTTEGLYQGTIKIWAIRNVLQQRLATGPLLGPRHICIIDDAHKMQEPAQNCLLKTLEEPPLGTVIILVSENPSALLPTILSRCQLANFERLPTDSIERFLTERRGLARDIAPIIASFAAGSLGRAILVDPDEFLRRRTAASSIVDCVIGRKIEALFSVLDGALGDAASSRAKQRQSALELLDMLSVLVRDAMVRKEGGENAKGISPSDAGVISLSDAYGVSMLLRLDQAVRQAREKIAGNANIRLALEAMVLGYWLKTAKSRA
ncbi:MAG TPA: hypothetical protein VM163_05525 [bacterium]|nr:hypothetical protein [bacterium]